MRVVRNNNRNAAPTNGWRQPRVLLFVNWATPESQSPPQSDVARGAGASVRRRRSHAQFQRQVQMTSKALSSPVCARTVKRRATR